MYIYLGLTSEAGRAVIVGDGLRFGFHFEAPSGIVNNSEQVQ